jgi:hypothetical protein
MARLTRSPSRRDLLRAGTLGAAGLALPQLLHLQETHAAGVLRYRSKGTLP